MSYEENLRSRTLEADASIGIYTGVPGQPGSAVPNNGKQYCAVKLTGTHQCGLATGLGDIVVGVLQNKPQRPGAAATVGYEGVTNVMAGGVFAAGIEIVADATGRFVAGTGTGRGLRFMSEAPSSGAAQLVPASIF